MLKWLAICCLPPCTCTAVTSPNLGYGRRKSSRCCTSLELADHQRGGLHIPRQQQLRLSHQEPHNKGACSLPAFAAGLSHTAEGELWDGEGEGAFFSRDGCASDALQYNRTSPFQVASLEYGQRSSLASKVCARDVSCSDKGRSGNSSSGSGDGSGRSSKELCAGPMSLGALDSCQGLPASGGSAACVPDPASAMPDGCAAAEGAQEPLRDHQGTGTGTAGGGPGTLAQTEDVPGHGEQPDQPGPQQPTQEHSQPRGKGLQEQQQHQQHQEHQQQPLQPACAGPGNSPTRSMQQGGPGSASTLPWGLLSSASSMQPSHRPSSIGIKEQGPLGSQFSDALSTDMCR